MYKIQGEGDRLYESGEGSEREIGYMRVERGSEREIGYMRVERGARGR